MGSAERMPMEAWGVTGVMYDCVFMSEARVSPVWGSAVCVMSVGYGGSDCSIGRVEYGNHWRQHVKGKK